MGKRTALRQAASLLLVLLLVAVTITPISATPAAARGIAAVVDYPLKAISATSATGKVRAIVQGSDRNRIASAVERSGGSVVRDLDIADGLAIEVPARAISALAKEPGVKHIAYDAPMVTHGVLDDNDFTPAKLATAYPWALGAPPLWQGRKPVTGRGVGIALIDSGIAPVPDFGGDKDGRIRVSVHIGSSDASAIDSYGHGTAIAGVIGGNGEASQGKYVGIAPEVNFINLKVGDNTGTAYASDVIAAIRWAVAHKREYNIRVLNLSLTSSIAESYKTSLLDLAVEYAWFNGIVVVVAAGNDGPNSVLFPPANDPYVLTVGATDDRGTKTTSDDMLAAFSSYGKTEDGFAKPELVAPGRHIVSVLASPSSTLAALVPDHVVDNRYIGLSGTSLSAGQISGVVALLLQAHPNYRPDQVKWLLTRTADAIKGKGEGKSAGVVVGTGAGYPNAQRAVSYAGPVSLGNRGLVPNTYLAQAVAKVLFDGVSWDGVSWDGVSWDGVSWDGVSWDGVSWDGVSWDGVSWDGVSWDGVSWDVILTQ